ncbi:MAG: molybdopterin molybdotransferase MoeA [Acidobacteriota bacterium]|nr:molybdopterin molybdotransferase MoeA [Acidobacteriota bacterium]
MAELLDLAAARRIALESAHGRAVEAEPIELARALGRVLAEDVGAECDLPAFASSAMDGFAVRALDTAATTEADPATLEVVAESRAGHPAERALAEGQAIAISTGAVVPQGADAVVRVEETVREGSRVAVLKAVLPGTDVRGAGEDVRAGEPVLSRGTTIGAAELGVLASLGHANVACAPRPRVRILTTGDELVQQGSPLRVGTLYDSNSHSLAALARCAGAEVIGTGHAPDDPALTRDALAATLDCDVALICGGISVGAHDHVKEGLAALGVSERFHGIALRPGKPAWFGLKGSTLVFGLPGNPVSAMVTFVLLAGPALRTLAGARETGCALPARLAHPYEKPPGRTHAVRCRLRAGADGLLADPTGPQGSHILTSMLGADALALIPRECGRMEAGAAVEVELLAPWVGWMA